MKNKGEMEDTRFAEAVHAVICGAATARQKTYLEARMRADAGAFEEYGRQLETHLCLTVIHGGVAPAAGHARHGRPTARAAALIPFLLAALLAAAAAWRVARDGGLPRFWGNAKRFDGGGGMNAPRLAPESPAIPKGNTTMKKSMITAGLLAAPALSGPLIWDGSQNAGWDTSSANWHTNGAANGTAVFNAGDSAVFPAAATVTLARDIQAGGVDVTIAPGATWTLDGEKTLDFSGGLVIHGAGNAVLDEPLLAGSGGLVFDSPGTLRLGNATNAFAGPLGLWQGALLATATGPVNTPLGAGQVHLGATGPATASAHLQPAGQNVSTPVVFNAGGLFVTGGYNAGRITPNAMGAAAGGVDMVFDSLQHDPGATLTVTATQNATLNPGGSNERIFFNTPPPCDLPPWFVIARSVNGSALENGGNYAVYDPALGVTRRAYPNPNVFGPGVFALVTTPTTLTGDAQAAAVQLQGANLNLGGNTLHLGGDGSAGVLFQKNYNVSILNGALDLGGNILYAYSEQGEPALDATLLDTPSLRKFGNATLFLGSTNLPPLVVAQEGSLVFNNAAPVVWDGQFRGAGSMSKRGAAPLTLAGEDAPVEAQNLGVNYGGVLRILQGAVVVRNEVNLDYVSHVTLSNATLSVGANTFMVGRAGNSGNPPSISRDNVFHIRRGGILSCGSFQVGAGTNGCGNAHIIDGGAHVFNTALFASPDLRVGATAGNNSNRVEVVNGGQFLFTAGDSGIASVGYNGSWNTLVVSNNASASVNQFFMGMTAASHYNSTRVMDGAVLTNYNANIGNSGSWNTLLVDNARVHNRYGYDNALNIGASGHSNLVSIVNKGAYANTGASNVGQNGCDNTLLVGDGAFIGGMALYIGRNNTALRNRVELRPGALLRAPSVIIGNTANTGNHLLLAGGGLEAGSLALNGGNFIAVELQPGGLPGHARISGAVNLDGARVRVSAARDTPFGAYPIITSDTGMSAENLILEFPGNQQGRWGWDVKGNALVVFYRAAPTLFLVK